MPIIVGSNTSYEMVTKAIFEVLATSIAHLVPGHFLYSPYDLLGMTHGVPLPFPQPSSLQDFIECKFGDEPQVNPVIVFRRSREEFVMNFFGNSKSPSSLAKWLESMAQRDPVFRNYVNALRNEVYSFLPGGSPGVDVQENRPPFIDVILKQLESDLMVLARKEPFRLVRIWDNPVDYLKNAKLLSQTQREFLEGRNPHLSDVIYDEFVPETTVWRAKRAVSSGAGGAMAGTALAFALAYVVDRGFFDDGGEISEVPAQLHAWSADGEFVRRDFVDYIAAKASLVCAENRSPVCDVTVLVLEGIAADVARHLTESGAQLVLAPR